MIRSDPKGAKLLSPFSPNLVDMGLSENSVSHIPMDYHHVPHKNCYLWVSPIFRQTHIPLHPPWSLPLDRLTVGPKRHQKWSQRPRRRDRSRWTRPKWTSTWGFQSTFLDKFLDMIGWGKLWNCMKIIGISKIQICESKSIIGVWLVSEWFPYMNEYELW